MNTLPDDAFLPATGKLGQLVFENPGAGIETRLEFFVEIAFRPFEWEDETLAPILRLNGISPSVRKWTELASQSLEFPYHPKPGSIDAGIHLFHVQNPADVTRISFGEIADEKLSVQFDTEVDFEIEADSELGQVELSIDYPLEVDSLRVATSIEKRHQGDEGAIAEAVAELVDLSAYGSIEKVPGGFAFPV